MKKTLLVILLLSALVAPAQSLQTPDQFLGFQLGGDGNLARYDRIKAYFELLAKNSPRVRTVNLGKTTLGNDLFMALISEEANLKDIDKLKAVTRALSQGEVDAAEAGRLAAAGKAIVVITCNLHSTEIASSQMAMELGYRLAAGGADVQEILGNVVLALFPSVNPDGQIMEVDWFNKTRGTEYEGTGAPYLYHWYAGHDNNRDWFKASLKETGLILKALYHDLYPQVLVDEHQMGSSGDRLFIPPYQDPPTPGLHPLVWRSINLIGSRIAYDLERLGLKGVASRGDFSGWWIGSLDDTAWFHNIPGILFEGASVRLAAPIFIEPEEVRSAESFRNEERVFSPNPWKGGWWRLSDLVHYGLQASLSVLATAARQREELLLNTYQVARENIARGESEAPTAFIVPRQQHDPVVAERFIQALLKSNIRVFQLTHPVRVGDSLFDKRSYVVPLAQPYRAFVRNIFDRQRYPDIRKSRKAEPELPYDMAAWTLPLGMGVRTAAVNEPLKALMEPVSGEQLAQRPFPEELDEYIVLDSRHNSSYRAAFELLAKGLAVYRNADCPDFAAGSFAFRKSEALALLKGIHAEAPLAPVSRKELPLARFRRLRPFKAGLYQNWGHNMTEGWLRYVFDEYRIPYETVRPKDAARKDWEKKFDVMVFAGASETEIESGKPPKKWEKWSTPAPPEYSGGIGEQGQKLLQDMVKKGKTLVFMEESCNYAIAKFKLPVTNVIEDNEKVVCPGSYLRAEVKESPLTLGMDRSAAVFFRSTPTFETRLPRVAGESRSTPLVFADHDLLLSGWLEGEAELARRSLLVDYRRGKGRIILIGPDVIHRTHGEGTYKIMFNSLLAAAEE
ncbi:MAG: M14 family metallopeptidase [Acidobacteria bacterium]|jgi:hypothetical protein|nr:M14 family metallopeptidase [Acidobacteriota bacterium]